MPQQSQTSQTLLQSALFNDWNEAELNWVCDCATLELLPPHCVLLEENQPAQAVYILKTGRIHITARSELLAEISSVQSFGEMSCILPDTRASATVETVTPCEVYKINKPDFLELLNRVPKLWKTLFSQLSERLKRSNQRISEILEHIPQGLLKLDAQAHITNEYSGRCLSYFGLTSLTGLAFKDLIFPQPEHAKQACDWKNTFDLLFEDTLLPFNDLKDLLVKDICLNPNQSGREFVLDYHPSKDSQGHLVGIDVCIEDVTAQKKLQREHLALFQKQLILGKVYKHPELFFQFVQEVDCMISECAALLNDTTHPNATLVKAQILRNLHTLKGQSGVFELGAMRSEIHALESTFNRLFAEPIPDLNTRFSWLAPIQHHQAQLHELIKGMGPTLQRRLKGLVLDQTDLQQLKHALNTRQFEQAQAVLDRLELVDVSELFTTWPHELEQISLQLGKKSSLEIKASAIGLPRNRFQDLALVCNHLLINAIIHGIESVEERRQAGKPEVGLIRVEASSENGFMVLAVSDDGRGVDENKLVLLARNKPELNPSTVEHLIDQNQILQIMLLPGFSTAEHINAYAGRGVGLDAVNNRVKCLGGQIHIQSEQGRGICFEIRIPLTTD